MLFQGIYWDLLLEINCKNFNFYKYVNNMLILDDYDENDILF